MRQALGRGLGALIPEAAEKQALAEQAKVVRIPISIVRPNHLQARRHFDPEKLSELAQSIKENGLAQPIVVSHDEATNIYELIAGERRLRAAQLAGLAEIDAIVKAPPSDRHRLQLTLIENLQREDLNPIELAHGYLRLMKEFAITQTHLSELLGKSKSAVSNTLRLMELPDDVQQALHAGQITEGHARALLMIKNSVELINIFHRALQSDLSVREVEELARRVQAGGALHERRAREAEKKSPDIRAVEESLQRLFGTKVGIRVGKKDHGTITVHFFSLDDFDRIINIINK